MDGDASANRFAAWNKGAARAVLALLALLILAAALVRIEAAPQKVAVKGINAVAAGSAGPARPRDDDLQVYDAVIERLKRGENYYTAAAAEHRRIGFPLRPGFAVRLPTLAWLEAHLGPTAQMAAAFALFFGVLAAWWRRLGEEPGGAEVRLIATALLALGMSLAFNRYFFVLHELWAGGLLALSLGLHRPGRRWGGALLAAALALAIREHALPFVLLMAAMALWRRDWREGAAWSLLALVFIAALAWHLALVAQQVQPGDPASASWLTFRGLSGWLSAITLSSNLRLLPHWLAGPAVVLMLLGWAGWRSPAGLTGTLLFAGYGLLFAVAGRAENYYWGAMVAPAMFIGLALAPRALKGLRSAAFSR